MKEKYLKQAIESIYSRDDDFILVGLTGRTGSGCSTVASILTSDFHEIKHSLYTGNAPANNQQRRERIIAQASKNLWQPFNLIQVRSVITLMLLECNPTDISNFFEQNFKFNEKNHSGKLAKKRLKTIFNLANKNKTSKMDIKFYTKTLPRISETMKKALGGGDFVKLYQVIGRNIRTSGSPISSKAKDKAFFTLAEKINSIAKEIHKENKENSKSTFIVIDAIRSPLEAIFFHERYASFFLMAVSCIDSERKERLRNIGYSNIDIEKIDEQEGKARDIDKTEFFSFQDIPSCLQRADIYVSNPDSKSEVEKFNKLANKILTFYSLMRHPGIITPTAIERCMQVAYTAKLNSGCISRQVGAAVTDDNFSIKSIGWNDVPEGQVSCNMRNRFDLVNGFDAQAYSKYEKSDQNFINQIKISNKKYEIIKNEHRNISYCFKSEFNQLKKEKNQVHTRALHAEENAFLQISKYGGIGLKDGCLFSTASPCELCAKKSYQLGIRKIFYIDPYPGISEEHILSYGDKSPQMILFSGVVGEAYHRLFSPIVPYKDELEALCEK